MKFFLATIFLSLSRPAFSIGHGFLIKDCNLIDFNANLTGANNLDAIEECRLSALSQDPEEILKIFEEFYGQIDQLKQRHQQKQEALLIKNRVKRIVGGQPADPPLIFRDDGAGDAVIFIDDDDNERSAKISGTSERHYTAYRGIRFADPPVNYYRFQRPRRKVLKGQVNATSFGPPCAQYDARRQDVIGSEDCLFLNVFTPKNKSPDLLPVIFWIHGGGFLSGSAAQYDPVSLVDKNLIVVTTQYRLGSLGFLGDSTKDLPGNAGLFDIVAALHWTRTYIKRFGGDPDKIVASGQGSGASIANFLGQSEFTRDLISGIFAMSGTSISSFAVDDQPVAFANNITRLNRCDETRNKHALVKCMQKISLKNIIIHDHINSESRLSSESFVTLLSKSLNPSAVVEGQNDEWFLPYFLNQPPLDALQKKMYAEIPMLTGVTLHETSTAVKGGMKERVLQVLSAVPQYMERVLPSNLLVANTGLIINGTINALVSTLFSKLEYLNFFTVNIPSLPVLDKVVQMTTDAIFNLPVFLTSNLRSTHARTYLYSFEHPSKAGKAAAKIFLPELPITQSNQNNAAPSNEVGNGEDLVHLFDVRSLEGQEINGISLDRDDMQIRDVFSSLVAEFAYTGKPVVKNSQISWSPFSNERTEYLAIKPNPELKTDFRFCEMGLWTGLLDRLKSPKCNLPNINSILSTIPVDLWDNSLTNVVRNVGDILPSAGNIPGVGTIVGGAQGAQGVLTGTANSVGGAVGGSLPTGAVPGVVSGATNPVSGTQGVLTGATSGAQGVLTGGNKPVGGLLGLGQLNSNQRPPYRPPTRPQTSSSLGLFSSIGGLFG